MKVGNMNKKALISEAIRLKERLETLNKLIGESEPNTVKLPKGFIKFEVKLVSQIPKNVSSKDRIVVLRRSGRQETNTAGYFYWSHCLDLRDDIVGYKLISKYVEPKYLTLAEMPVGTLFKCKDPNDPQYFEYTFIKTSDNKTCVVASDRIAIAGYYLDIPKWIKEFYKVSGTFLVEQQPMRKKS